MSERRGVCDIVIAVAGSTRRDGRDDDNDNDNDDAKRIAVVDARHFAVFIYGRATPRIYGSFARAASRFRQSVCKRAARGTLKRGRGSLTVKYGMHRKPDGNMYDRRSRARIDA